MYQLEEGQTFQRKGTKYELVYFDDDAVLLKYSNNHRLEDKEYFLSSIDSGYFEPEQEMIKQSNSDSRESNSQEIPYKEISWVGEAGAESLRSSGYSTIADVECVTDEKLLSCESVGETAVENIRNWIENNE